MTSERHRCEDWTEFGIWLTGNAEGRYRVMRERSEIYAGKYRDCVMFAEELYERIALVRAHSARDEGDGSGGRTDVVPNVG